MKPTFLLLLSLMSYDLLAEIKIQNGRIYLINEETFEKKLEIKKLEATSKGAALRETGFIVSNAQSTFLEDSFTHKWVSLDDQVLSDNHVDLTKVSPLKGLSYGVIQTSKDFVKDLKVGQEVTVRRYGLPEDHFKGRVIKILKFDNQDIIQVHFTVSNAHELIAGSTCEVEIPHIKKTPFKVSLLALLHLGVEDYIVIKDKDGSFYPKHATIIDQNSKDATILLPVSPDESYVGRGSILLKPLLTEILTHSEVGP